MNTVKLGLALGLLGSVALGGTAMAQTPPSPPPARPLAAAPIPPMPAPQPNAPVAPPAPQGQQNAQSGQPAMPAPSGPPEGMIVETPNGFFLVRPGDPNPQRLDLGRNGGGMAQQGMNQQGMGPQGMTGRPGMDRPMPGQNGPAAMAEGEDAMADMAEDGQQSPPPHSRRAPPRPPEGKGAHIHIHTPNIDVNVKCPDDEPVKACVDAISQLMDKSNTPAH